jgi:D-alanine transaminase
LSRVAFVNGRYRPLRQDLIAVEDRGYQFADGVYEVIAVLSGRMIDANAHLDRLERSLDALEIPMPATRRAVTMWLQETVRRNRVVEGVVYLQVSRGIARREHVTSERLRPSVVVTARSQPFAKNRALAKTGVRVITRPDLRWRRCDVKTIQLVANVMAKREARRQGAFEAWLFDREGFVTEGGSTNAWIVEASGAVITRPTDGAILVGVTRQALLGLAREAGIETRERKFSVTEAKAAREAFLTSTTSAVLPVIAIDESTIGDGRPGPVCQKLVALYGAYLERAAEGLPPAGVGETKGPVVALDSLGVIG